MSIWGAGSYIRHVRVTLEVPSRLLNLSWNGDRSLSAVPCGSEPVFVVTTFISETSLRSNNVLVMPKYEGQLEINWLQEKGGKQRDRGQELPRCTFSHGNALSAMSHTKVMLHLPRGRTGELNKKD